MSTREEELYLNDRSDPCSSADNIVRAQRKAR